MLKLTQKQLTQLYTQAVRCYPEECCGLLLGQGETVMQIWGTANSWQPDFFTEDFSRTQNSPPKELSRRNRFAIAPRDILQAQKAARAENLNIIGIYHSHPDHPAVPSEYDRAIAWDIYSYLIFSVTQEQVVAMNSWRLDGDRQFQAENIQIIPA